ncbi:unnamed protein product, partial [Choristocarpus tenellus]
VHSHKESFLSPRGVNSEPLTPIPWLERSARIFPERTALVYGDDVRMSYKDLLAEARRLGGAIARAGIGEGDVVSAMVPNVPMGLVVHFSVPGAGAVLHMVNTRLDPKTIAFQLEHAESKLLFVDCELMDLITQALEMMEESERPRVVQVPDPYLKDNPRQGEQYEDFLR